MAAPPVAPDALQQELATTRQELASVISAGKEAEAKTAASLSKLQMMSKSQTAILRANFTKKIAAKDVLLDEVLAALGAHDGAAAAALGGKRDAAAGGGAGGGGGGGDAALAAEVAALRAETTRLEQENKHLRANGGGGGGGGGGDAELSEKVGSLEAEKEALLELLREAQDSMDAGDGGGGGGGGGGGFGSPGEKAALEARLRSAEAQLATGGGGGGGGDDDDVLKALLTESQSQLEAQAAELASLRAQLSAKGASAADAAAAAAQSGDLSVQLGAVQAQLATQEASLAQARTAAAAASAKASADAASLTAAHDAAIGSVRAEEEAKQSELLSEMASELESSQQAAATKAAALETTLAKLQEGGGALRRGVANIAAQATAQKAQVAALRSAVAQQLAQYPVLAKDFGRQVEARIAQHAAAMDGVVTNYRKEVVERKRLFNLVQELRGNIRVFVRVRPVSSRELRDGASIVVTFPGENEIALVNERGVKKRWEFDQVFQMDSEQQGVYKEVSPLVTSMLDGFNVCIFAYGQTGSGKTFTMAGPPDNRGVNTNALDELFVKVEERKAEFRDELTVAILEIYNENIRDLLAEHVGDRKLSVKNGPDGNYVPELTTVPVSSLEEVLELIELGDVNRTAAATDMNEHSSRSHSIVQVFLNSVNVVTGAKAKGKLNMIDLAGSERVGKSGATGARLKEAQNINKSLSALGDVIQARCNKQGHVPYRNSTLTHMLQDSLEKDSKTLMFGCLSPAAFNSEESVCTLNWAARARTVELGKATKHVSKS